MRKHAVGIAVVVVGVVALVGYGLATMNSTAPAEPSALRAGRTASDFSIQLFSGGTFSLAEQRGKVVVVNFWASWCPPCKEEAPAFERAWRTYRDRGVVFVGVDLWDNERDAKAFLDKYGITYPNGPDPNGEIGIEYGVTGLPETWFLDRAGKQVRRWIGPMTERQMIANIEEALR